MFHFHQPEPEPEPEPEEEPTDFYENVEMPDTQPDSTYDTAEEQLQEEPAKYEAEEPAEPDSDNLYDNMGMDAAPAQVLLMPTTAAAEAMLILLPCFFNS